MTTILCIRKNNEVVMAGDGQATLGETVIFKSKSVKVRRIGNGKIIALSLIHISEPTRH